MHDAEGSGRPSVIADELVELVRESIMEDRRFTIAEFSSHFPLLVTLNYHAAPGV